MLIAIQICDATIEEKNMVEDIKKDSLSRRIFQERKCQLTLTADRIDRRRTLE